MQHTGKPSGYDIHLYIVEGSHLDKLIKTMGNLMGATAPDVIVGTCVVYAYKSFILDLARPAPGEPS